MTEVAGIRIAMTRCRCRLCGHGGPCTTSDLGNGCTLVDCGDSGMGIECNTSSPLPPIRPPTILRPTILSARQSAAPRQPPPPPDDECGEGANPFSAHDGMCVVVSTTLSTPSGLAWQRITTQSPDRICRTLARQWRRLAAFVANTTSFNAISAEYGRCWRFDNRTVGGRFCQRRLRRTNYAHPGHIRARPDAC